MENKKRIILTLSPGSTSTKIAVFHGRQQLLKENISHDPDQLKSYAEAKDQFCYRLQTILETLNENQIGVETIDAYAAYSGGLEPSESGIFPVNEKMLEDSLSGRINHPAVLGAALIKNLADRYGKPCFVIDPPDSDEFCDLARITGIKGVYRECRIHVLNQKAAARKCAESLGRKYDSANFIVAHIGGGLSVAAHDHGRIIDGNDVLNGSGPMAPNRSGTLPARAVVDMCFSGEYTKKQMKDLIGKTGGLISHLGTDSVKEIEARIHEGDAYAKLILDAMAYQTAKEIGALASVLEGNVDGIALTGGVANDEYYTGEIIRRVQWIAPVKVFGGDFEMEALADGVNRALDHEEETKVYSGQPVFQGFDSGS